MRGADKSPKKPAETSPLPAPLPTPFTSIDLDHQRIQQAESPLPAPRSQGATSPKRGFNHETLIRSKKKTNEENTKKKSPNIEISPKKLKPKKIAIKSGIKSKKSQENSENPFSQAVEVEKRSQTPKPNSGLAPAPPESENSMFFSYPPQSLVYSFTSDPEDMKLLIQSQTMPFTIDLDIKKPSRMSDGGEFQTPSPSLRPGASPESPEESDSSLLSLDADSEPQIFSQELSQLKNTKKPPQGKRKGPELHLNPAKQPKTTKNSTPSQSASAISEKTKKRQKRSRSPFRSTSRSKSKSPSPSPLPSKSSSPSSSPPSPSSSPPSTPPSSPLRLSPSKKSKPKKAKLPEKTASQERRRGESKKTTKQSNEGGKKLPTTRTAPDKESESDQSTASYDGGNNDHSLRKQKTNKGEKRNEAEKRKQKSNKKEKRNKEEKRNKAEKKKLRRSKRNKTQKQSYVDASESEEESDSVSQKEGEDNQTSMDVENDVVPDPASSPARAPNPVPAPDPALVPALVPEGETTNQNEADIIVDASFDSDSGDAPEFRPARKSNKRKRTSTSKSNSISKTKSKTKPKRTNKIALARARREEEEEPEVIVVRELLDLPSQSPISSSLRLVPLKINYGSWLRNVNGTLSP